MLLWSVGLLAFVYLFVCTVDPWDILPLSPPLPRVPVSSNARFSFPGLARQARFDSAVFGTSTARLLRPVALDAALGGRFANLAMNSATAYEQTRLLEVFLRAHPQPRTVVIGLDAQWCGPAPEKYTPRPMPEWMYEPATWPGYGQMLNGYAVQEAAAQFAVMIGVKRPPLGRDGYTRFTPPDSEYDPVRVAAAFARWPRPGTEPPGLPPAFPALVLLRDALAALPPATRQVLFFAPYQHEFQGLPGTAEAARWAGCKAEVRRLAPHATIADFLLDTPLTRDRAHYWDPLHYREPVADRIAAGLALAMRGKQNEDFRLPVSGAE